LSVKRRDLVQYLEANGFHLLREGEQTLRLHEWEQGTANKEASHAG